MTETLIITISGKARHGKDSLAFFLKRNLEEHGKKGIILHYADYLKYIAKTYYDWDGNKDVNGRTLLQSIGEHARQEDPKIWVNTMYGLIFDILPQYDFVIIPDTRYPNEIFIWDLEEVPYVTIKIDRPNFDNGLTAIQKNHYSENALNDYHFDYEVKNGGDLEDLRQVSVYLGEEIYERIYK